MRFPPLHPSAGRHIRGVALIIVLSFVVLLTGLILAFFSRSLSERQISNSSAGQVKTDLFTQGAIATIVDDLKQEIAAGSNATYYVDATGNQIGSVYVPAYPQAVVPALALKGNQTGNSTQVTAFALNLLKRSASQQDFFSGKDKDNNSLYNNGNTTLTLAIPAGTGATPSPNPAPIRSPSNRAATFPANGPNPGKPLATTIPSQNGRAISATRWNKPLLMPKDPSPIGPKNVDDPARTAFVAPDWILVARDGSNPGGIAYDASGQSKLVPVNFDPTQTTSLTNSSPSNSGYVTGRFAYTIYDEGGLLDANVAGYPTGTYPSSGTNSLPPTPTGKTALAYADLTVPILKDASTPGSAATDFQPLLTTAQVNALVGWRNYASGKFTGALPTYTSLPTPAQSPNFTDFDRAIFNNANGFLGISSVLNDTDKQSDRKFGTRQELISFFTQALATSAADKITLKNSLQYFSTFSRGLNQPSYAPVSRVATATNQNFRPLIQPSAAKGGQPGGGNNVGDNYTAAEQDIFSPSLLSVRVRSSGTPQWVRNDGTTSSVVGEPLLKSRFALQRLAWIYYKGPSAEYMGDYGVKTLISDYGVDKALLLKGTGDTGGTIGNIHKYFGLTWDANNHCWKYNVHNGNGSGTGSIMKLQDIAALPNDKAREPDFFEILKASVDMGALGKTSTKTKQSQPGEPASGGPDSHLQPLNLRFYQDVSVDAAIIQLGANIIDQYDLDGYPTRIVFNDGTSAPGAGSGDREFHGVENLPYIYRVRTGTLKVRDSNPQSENPPNGSNATLKPQLHSGVQAGFASSPLIDTGAGVIMAIPDIWNPHDQNSSLGIPGPGQNAVIRLVANSASPETIYATNTGAASLNGYSKFLSGGYVKTEPPYGGIRTVSFNDALAPSTTATPPIPYFTRGANPSGTLNSSALTMSGSNGGFNYPHEISPTTTNYLTFKVPTGNTLYHEPTMLGQADSGGASGLTMVLAPSYLDIKNLQGAGGALAYSPSTGLKGLNGNPLGIPGAATNQASIGLVLGTYPLRWVGPRWSGSNMNTQWNYSDQSPADGGQPVSAITYSLQYQDPSGSAWITYDEKYVDSDVTFMTSWEGDLNQPKGGNYVFVDPRTPRFGSPTENNIGYNGNMRPFDRAPISGNTGSWLDYSTKVLSLVTEKPDANPGFGSNFRGTSGSDWGGYAALGLHTQGINTSGGVNAIFWQTGMFAQNDPTVLSGGLRFNGDNQNGVGQRDPNFWTGSDGVVRRAMGAHAQAGIIGQPLATATNFANGANTPKPPALPNVPAPSQSRPVVLNRPFRSVGELGCVYSGNPWMNIDFSTPESAYSELLDVFCVSENAPPDGMVAGVVNLNTRQPAVLKSVLTGAYVDDQNTFVPAIKGSVPVKPLGTSDADVIAKLLTTRTSSTQPLQNVGDLVGRWTKKATITRNYVTPLDTVHNIDGKMSYDGLVGDLTTLPNGSSWVGYPAGLSDEFVKISRFREAAVRSLSSVGNTRVWNVMIDVIAQNGRYPAGANAINNFVVEGEQRCWVHLAIDRYSGAVLDTKLEVVKE